MWERILIADDYEAIRRGLHCLLQHAGWQVCGEVADGKEAVEKTKQLRPDLVILDVNMPLMNGLEAAREIRKSVPEVRVLMFTICDSEQDRREAVCAGAHGFARKSAPPSELLDNIRVLLNNRIQPL